MNRHYYYVCTHIIIHVLNGLQFNSAPGGGFGLFHKGGPRRAGGSEIFLCHERGARRAVSGAALCCT